jgi:hypothetical protein
MNRQKNSTLRHPWLLWEAGKNMREHLNVSNVSILEVLWTVLEALSTGI